MVIGEAEIIGQVREALAAAGSQAGPSLTRLFHAALTTAKAVTAQTDLGAAGRSIATVGLELVEKRHFPLAGRSALLVGTGSYARVVTAALVRRGCTDVTVYSPTGRAEQFAATHPVQPVGEDGLAEAIAGDRPAGGLQRRRCDDRQPDRHGTPRRCAGRSGCRASRARPLPHR